MKQRKDTIDILGQKFSDLTAVELVGPGKYRGARWRCICVCGNETIVPGGHLRAGMRKSCGCRSELKIEETGVNRILSMYKRKARLRKKIFELSREQFEILIKSNCAYCGIEPAQILKRSKSDKLQILYNGIDRIDSSTGYVFDNCVAACRYCNQAKSDLSFEEWKIHLKRICLWLSIDS